MFTGIIENSGIIQSVFESGTNKTFLIRSELASSLKVDQSLAHDGVCLTVEAVSGETYQVTAIAETLQKTCLNQWSPGYPVNLERAMVLTGRLDGHIVQGHVDGTALCISRVEEEGSSIITLETSHDYGGLMIEKGSICINGISLTIFNVKGGLFSVAVIPYTSAHTNIGILQPGTRVNVEFDVIGKYVQKLMQKSSA